MVRLRLVFLSPIWMTLACFAPSSDGDGGTGSSSSTSGPTGTAATTAPSATNTNSGTMSGTGTLSTGPTATMTSETSETASTTDPDTSATSDGSDSTGGAVCPNGSHACISPAPGGWTGPLAMWSGDSGDTPPGCAEGYPDLFDSLNADLQVPPTVCDCTCANPTGVTCQGVTFDTYANSACSGAALATGVGGVHQPNQCDLIGQTPFTTWHLDASNGGVLTPGQCNDTLNETIPPATWDSQVRACGGDVLPDGCDLGFVCAPVVPASFMDLCIAQVGDVACPAGPYSDRTVVFGSIDDDRDCSTCTCAAPLNTCGGVLQARSGGCAAGTTLLESIELGTCSDNSHHNVNNFWVRYVPSTPTCGSGSSSPIGSAVAADPTTFCCLP